MPEVFSCGDEDSVSSDDSSCASREHTSLNTCLDACALAECIQSQRNKQRRMGHSEKDLRPVTFVRFNTRLGKPKPITVKCSLDSGASGSLINAKFTKKLRVKRASTTAVWSTPAGEMSTLSMVNGMFAIPESQEKKLIEWPLHVVKNMGPHDMILGRDVMSFFFLRN